MSRKLQKCSARSRLSGGKCQTGTPPEKAIAFAKKHRARLIIAKLDRLSPTSGQFPRWWNARSTASRSTK